MSWTFVRCTITSDTVISAELQQPAEHVALGALDLALAMQDVDGPHQLLVAGNARILLDERDAAQS